MNEHTTVPLVDLGIQHAEIADEVRQGFDRVLATGAFVLGPEVEQFEAEFAKYCGVDHVIGVGNGTDALELALRAGGIGRNDEVVLPANTFVATAEAVVRAGARITLVDCDEDFLIDPARVAEAVTSRTKAVIGVHLYGQIAAIEELRRVAGPDVLLVEDAAQAQGARRFGSRAGGLGDVAATSFYPGKNLGAYGDGGAVMTGSAIVAERVRALRNHGGMRRYEHLLVGMNSRLDGLQAVVLRAKLSRLDEWNRLRREAAAHYDELLSDLPDVVTPRVVEGNEHAFHLYVIRVPHRDTAVETLSSGGIATAIHYPLPIHQVPAFSFLGYQLGAFPVAESMAGEIMSLPLYPGITQLQQESVVAQLARALATSHPSRVTA